MASVEKDEAGKSATPSSDTPADKPTEAMVDSASEENKTAATASDSELSAQADAAASSDNEALISDTESVGDSEEQKVAEKVKAINLEPAPAATEGSEEEEAKSALHKIAGNEAFKAKKFAEACEQYTEAIFC